MNDIQNRKDIEHLVEAFYARVFPDPLIGFLFTDVARVQPELHFPLMSDFWETILFGRNRYHGNPIHQHVHLNARHPLQPAHFDRWVELFDATVDDLFAGEKAETAKIRARAIATVLQAKMRTLNGQPVRG